MAMNVKFKTEAGTQLFPAVDAAGEKDLNQLNTEVDTLKAEVVAKQDQIENLDAIKAGASKGATAVQPADLDEYLTKAEADETYLKEHQSLADYSTTTQMNSAIAAHHDTTKQDTIADLDTVKAGAAAGATAVQPAAINDMLTKTEATSTYQTKITSSNKVAASNVSGLKDIATTAAFADLTNIPTVDFKITYTDGSTETLTMVKKQ